MTALLALLLAGSASAQVNTEKLRLSPEGEGFTGSVAVSLTVKTGNVDQVESSGSVGVASRWGKNMAFVVGTTKYATKRKRADRLSDYAEGAERTVLDEEHRYSNAHLVAARYNRFFTEKAIGEVFAQGEYNEFLLLDLRALAGVGGRFSLFDEEHADGWLGLGYMAELERLTPDAIDPDEPADVLAHRLTSYLTLSVMINERTDLTTTTYFQPRLTQLTDFRVYNESTLTLGLSEWLAWAVTFTLRHDSDPPALLVGEDEDVPITEQHLQPTDLAIVNKLTLTF